MRPCVGALVALAALAAPGVASAQIDGDTLDVFADAQGRLQIIPTGESFGVFFPPTSGTPNAGIEATIAGTPIPLGSGRTTISGPTLTPLPFGAVSLDSVYQLDIGGGVPELQVTEQLGYINGQSVVTGIYDIQNVSSTALIDVRIGALADLYSGGSDVGVGQLIGETPGRQLYGVNPSTGWKTALIEDTPWSAFQEGYFGAVFNNFQFATLDNTVDPNP